MTPLAGIVVVALEQAIAAPLCTRHLADLGARVIKIERPGDGDFARAYDRRARGMSSHFVWTNRSKESLTLDLKSDCAAQVLARLLPTADVLIQNLAPGASHRLGLSHASLSTRFPRLIVCDISGYGLGGPYADRKAYDLLVQGEAGFLSVTGTAEAPVKAGIPISDIAAGMYAYSRILAALIERGRTGRGGHIDISLLEAAVEWMGFPLYYSIDGASAPARNGLGHAAIYPYGAFPTADGEQVLFGIQNTREWTAFCEIVLRRPDLAADRRFALASDRFENRSELDPQLRQILGTMTAQQMRARLDQAQIAHANLNSMAQVWAHPQLAARGRWGQVDTEVGPLPALLPPGASADDRNRMDPVPALGAHTEPILRGLGFTPDWIAEQRGLGRI